jgi:hypothetical protein
MYSIHADIVRTSRHIHMLSPNPVEGQEFCPDEPNTLYGGHLRRLERFLYVFAITLPSLGYGQGFNELASVFYCVLFNARPFFGSVLDAPEALAYHCLASLLAHAPLAQLYNTAEPNATETILERMNDFNDVLRKYVKDISVLLDQYAIDPLNYAYRWMMVLFTQEYELPQILQIWDALFVRFDRLLSFAFFIGAAQIKIIKNDYSFKTPAEALRTLQHVTPRDVAPVLAEAKAWWEKDMRVTEPGKAGKDTHRKARGIVSFFKK